MLFFILVFSNNANAQFSSIIDKPIRVLELEWMTESLAMTDEQSEALLELYWPYLEEFSIVKQHEINRFVYAIAELDNSFGLMSNEMLDRKIVEDLITKARRSINAVNRVDSVFFDACSEMLTEQQLRTLQTIRISREQLHYKELVIETLGDINEGARVNMDDLFQSSGASPNEDTELILETYRARYLKKIKEGFGELIKMATLALDMVDELGFTGLNGQEIMQMAMADESVMADFKRRGTILFTPLINKASEISQLNWAAWKKLDSLLAQDKAQQLQRLYFNKSFRGVMRPSYAVSLLFYSALELDAINDEQRAALVALNEEFEDKWKKVSLKHATVLEQSRKEMTFAQATREVGSKYDGELAKRRDEIISFVSSYPDSIYSILGTELTQAMQDKKKTRSWGSGTASYRDGSTEKSTTTMRTNDKGETVCVTEKVKMKDGKVISKETTVKPYVKRIQGVIKIPEKLPQTFPGDCAAVLGFDDSSLFIIESVYDDYQESYRDLYADLEQLGKELHEDREHTASTREKKKKETNIRAAEEVAALDSSFFSDLSAVTGLSRDNKDLLMIEQYRQRQRLLAPDDPLGWRGVANDFIDLVGLYVLSEYAKELRASITEESKKMIAESMQNYHATIFEQHDAFVKAERELNQFQYSREYEKDRKKYLEYKSKWSAAYENYRSTKRNLQQAIQQVMDDILESVPEEDFWTVRLEYVKRAYPDVFKDKKDATDLIDAASQTQMIDASQQNKIEELANSHRYSYWELCEKMIKNYQDAIHETKDNPELVKKENERKLELMNLRHERSELNDLARMQLRLILTDNQIDAVPGLKKSAEGSIRIH